MTEEKKTVTEEILSYIDLAAIGAGAYIGYCEAQGIPIETENLQSTLTYGPTILHGGIGMTLGGGAGAGIKGIGYEGLEDIIRKDGKERSITAIAAGTGTGAVMGGLRGAIHTFLGTVIGYTAGYLTK